MWRSERRIPILLLLIACLVGVSQAVGRHIDANVLAAIGSRLRGRNPIRQMNKVQRMRDELGDLENASGDYPRAVMISALDNLLELRLFHRQQRCDDEAGDLVEAALDAAIERSSSGMSLTGFERARSLVYHWVIEIANKCVEGTAERLQEARSRLHPAIVLEIEGFLTDQYIDQFRSSSIGVLRDLIWYEVLDRFTARGQTPQGFSQFCKDYLTGMRHQVALARVVAIELLSNRPPSIMRTLKRFSFCEILTEPMIQTGLYDALIHRNFL